MTARSIPMTVTLLPGGAAVRMACGAWSHTVPLAELADWRDFYARLWARGSKGAGQPGPWAKYYAADLASLRDAVRRWCA